MTVRELAHASEEWAERSRRKEVCGILGCIQKPTVKCNHCQNYYCEGHKIVIGTPAHPLQK